MPTTISTCWLDHVKAKLEKANKRAVKLGVAPFSLSVTNIRSIPEPGNPDRLLERCDLELVGTPVVMPGGFELQGVVDYEDGMILVSGRPDGLPIPEVYRTEAGRVCDHCNTRRERKSVVLFANPSGQWKAIGRNCVADYFETSAEVVLWRATMLNFLSRACEDAAQNGPRPVHSVNVARVVAAAWRISAKRGWMSHSMASRMLEADPTRFVPNTTASLTSAYLWGGEPEDAQLRKEVGSIEQADEDKAAEIIAWGLATFKPAATSEYENSMLQLLTQETVREGRLAMVISVIAGYRRATEAAKERAARVNAYVGTVGLKRAFAARFIRERRFDTQFGVMFVGHFDTDEGEVVYKGSAPFWPEGMKVGESISFKGTIKTHENYQDRLLTYVQRCKVLEADLAMH